ncbi:hypothetical protein BTJ40_14185 [Microbulbifer sp. A4B17]|uniref:DUF2188 domain-containing protein n=1 Tax=Microbulbifer sp. A4B17 TaxID=359370 RepID=UPI000D52D587|nr:DUF2188 domain-containing protein [Microbulbifer sp. A4B17]AWF81881.1 hypothetical protein BTJ40_14185 [Microbulbifer sp. A4B17]
MERFAIFSGTYNLLMGGVKDFKQSFYTQEEALKEAKRIAKRELFIHWVQIFDKKTDKAKIYRIVGKELVEDSTNPCKVRL